MHTLTFSFTPPSLTPPARPLHLLHLSHPNASPSSHPSSSLVPSSIPFTLSNFPASDSKWSILPPQSFRRIVEAVDWVFPASEGGNKDGSPATTVLVKQINVVSDGLNEIESVKEWEKWMMDQVAVEIDGQRWTYHDGLCYSPEINEGAVACYGSQSAEGTHSIPHPLLTNSRTLTLYLRAPSPAVPTASFLNLIASRSLPVFTSSSNVTFTTLPSPGSASSWTILPNWVTDGAGLFPGTPSEHSQVKEREEEEQLQGLRSVRWLAYAVRALGMRFWALAKVSLHVSTKHPLTIRTPTLLISSLCCLATSSCTQRLSTFSSTCARWDPTFGSVRFLFCSRVTNVDKHSPP